MKRVISLGTGLAVALLAAACADPGVDAGAPARVSIASAPLDAALVTSEFGWLLTAEDLFTTVDGGRSFRATDVDLPVGSARAAYFSDARHGWVAAVDTASIAVARTVDGGDSWTLTRVPTPAQISGLSLAFGGTSTGALLAKAQTGSAFSVAELFSTADGGASWQARKAPVAGRVAVESDGRIWLAGGVFGDELYLSGDAGRSWARPRLQLTPAAKAHAVALPEGGILAVTAGEPEASRVALLTSADNGMSWREAGSAPLATDPGAAVPVVARGSDVLVIDPAGGRLHRAAKSAAGSALSVVADQSAGLPAGAFRITFGGPDAGWLLASSGACAGAKQDCTMTYRLSRTTNGGSTWQEILNWQEKIG